MLKRPDLGPQVEVLLRATLSALLEYRSPACLECSPQGTSRAYYDRDYDSATRHILRGSYCEVFAVTVKRTREVLEVSSNATPSDLRASCLRAE